MQKVLAQLDSSSHLIPPSFALNYAVIPYLAVLRCLYLNIVSLSCLLFRRKQNWTSWIMIIPTRGTLFLLIWMTLFTVYTTYRDIPYAPSFILDLPSQIDQNIHNFIDFVFLAGFNNPTLAVLFQTQQTWTGCVIFIYVVNI